MKGSLLIATIALGIVAACGLAAGLVLFIGLSRFESVLAAAVLLLALAQLAGEWNRIRDRRRLGAADVLGDDELLHHDLPASRQRPDQSDLPDEREASDRDRDHPAPQQRPDPADAGIAETASNENRWLAAPVATQERMPPEPARRRDPSFGDRPPKALRVEGAAAKANSRINSEIRISTADLRVENAAAKASSRASDRPPAANGLVKAVQRPAGLGIGDATLNPQALREALRDDRIDLCLEPIVQIPDRRTRYYAASLVLRRVDGRSVPMSELAMAAGAAGLASEFDLMLLRRVAPAIRHLSFRRADAAVFCPLSGTTATDPVALAKIAELFESSPFLAPHLVLDVGRAAAYHAHHAAIDAFRTLASHGVRFCAGATTDVPPDVAMLADWGVRFLAIKARDIDDVAGSGAPRAAAIGRLSSATHRHAIELIVTGVETESTLGRAAILAGLARGPLFAPPRPVRPDLADLPRENAAA